MAKNKFKRLRNEKGITLLESILGIMILAVGYLGLLPMMTNATAKTLDNDRYVISSYLANDKMESIIADKNFKGYATVTATNYPNENMNSTNPGYTRTTTITEVSKTDLTTPQVGSGYKKVVVEVQWGAGSAEKSTLTTLLTNY